MTLNGNLNVAATAGICLAHSKTGVVVLCLSGEFRMGWWPQAFENWRGWEIV